MKTTWGHSTKFYAERLRPEAQPLTLLYTFWTAKVPLSYTFYQQLKWYPFHIPILELCIPFNCCKYTVWIWINHRTISFSRLFHSHKMHLLALLGLFTDRNDRFPTLSYAWSPKIDTPFGRSHPVQGEYSPARGETIDCVYKGSGKGFWSLWGVKMWASLGPFLNSQENVLEVRRSELEEFLEVVFHRKAPS